MDIQPLPTGNSNIGLNTKIETFKKFVKGYSESARNGTKLLMNLLLHPVNLINPCLVTQFDGFSGTPTYHITYRMLGTG